MLFSKKWTKTVVVTVILLFLLSGAAAADSQPISNLKVGDKVLDPSWSWEHRVLNDNYTAHSNDMNKPVTWVVVAKNHYFDSLTFSTGFVSGNHVTLLTDQLIAKYAFDDSTNRGHAVGSNHWGNSGKPNAEHGAREFLNNDFYNAMSATFKEVVKETVLPNKFWDTGNDYPTRDMVFLPSSTELGDRSHINTAPIGKDWGYFSSASERTAEAEYYLFGGPGTTTDNHNYWTRSPDSRYTFHVKIVSALTGAIEEINASNGHVTLRPAVNVNAATRVSTAPNADGVYEIIPGDLEDDDDHGDDNGDDNGDVDKTISLTADPEGQSEVGVEVTFTASAEGFDNPEYQFGFRPSGAASFKLLQTGTGDSFSPLRYLVWNCSFK